MLRFSERQVISLGYFYRLWGYNGVNVRGGGCEL